MREIVLDLSISVNIDQDFLANWVGSSPSLRWLSPIISFFANLFANVDGAQIVLPLFAMKNEF